MRTLATSKSIPVVLERFAKWLRKADNDSRKFIADEMNRMLDELCGEDFFGTECQCDPRGDQRTEE